MTNNDKQDKPKAIQLHPQEEQQPILFNITQCGITEGIQHLVNEAVINELDLHLLLLKHMKNIDDNKHPEDIEYNLQAIKSGTGRVLSVYDVKDHRLYINSYMDKVEGTTVSIETVIMLTDEY